ncbi:hypothetical protein B0H17DRAFT_1208125 [Mycena rosella]|uniref:CxC2-like cysteine cluster KDZ transposase-associated domain-containing protein n=1 Tax=Mycena rosella TaxID=1033263 RepID=A0AAD7D1I6_MYCRO|nr:hypothetical protein B0H17DRAFT_1208125 [Mycena rosella]
MALGHNAFIPPPLHSAGAKLGMGSSTPEFEQLLQAGIFPGSVKDPKMDCTLVLLEDYQQLRSQGKGSASNFVLVLQRMADPFFAG